MKPHPLPSGAYLNECFLYDPDRGVLRWRRERPPEHFASVRNWRLWLTRHAGKDACHIMKELGYKRTRLDGVYYLSHRIIYKLMTLDDPPFEIDHKNTNRGDNRWDNLRPATRQQNVWNAALGHKTKSYDLPVGITVRSCRTAKPYKVECGKRYIGSFATLEAAIEARNAFATKERGQFLYQNEPRS
jgi:hypothetical protein